MQLVSLFSFVHVCMSERPKASGKSKKKEELDLFYFIQGVVVCGHTGIVHLRGGNTHQDSIVTYTHSVYTKH